MRERTPTIESNNQLYNSAIQSAVKHLRNIQPDIIICLGDSVKDIADKLASLDFNVTWLNHDQGHSLYQDGTVDDQTQRLKQVIGNHQKPLVFEDTMVSGGKLWQLHNAFDTAEIPFQAVVLAAPKELADDGITLISTNPKLISELQLRVSKFIDFRKSINLEMINTNLHKYEDLYDSFDGGHDRQHLIAVRNCALKLAKKYAPDKIDLVYIAATLHDIGLSVNRENHEIEGEKLIRADSDLKSQLSPEDFEELCHAVGQHRASTGKPKSVIAKIISDADRGGGLDDPIDQFSRAYWYGKKNYLDLSDEEQIWRAAKHQSEKFAPGSYGRRTYFPETEIRLNKIINPIIEAYQRHDLEFLKSLIKPLLN